MKELSSNKPAIIDQRIKRVGAVTTVVNFAAIVSLLLLVALVQMHSISEIAKLIALMVIAGLCAPISLASFFITDRLKKEKRQLELLTMNSER